MQDYKTIVVFGASGQLGQEIISVFKDHNPLAPSFAEADLCSPVSVVQYLDATQPTLVINCAAITNVDGCETQKSEAFLVNAITPGYISEWCLNNNISFVTYSSDYVFDGINKSGYTESETPHPLSVYGESKALMEQLCKGSYIIRTAYVFGKGNNFVKTIVNAARAGKNLTVIDDQFACRAYAADVAVQTKYMLDNVLAPSIYHVTNEGYMSHYELVQMIVRILGLETTIIPVRTQEYYKNSSTPVAPRPSYSRLINTKLPSLRPIEDALREYISTLE